METAFRYIMYVTITMIVETILMKQAAVSNHFYITLKQGFLVTEIVSIYIWIELKCNHLKLPLFLLACHLYP